MLATFLGHVGSAIKPSQTAQLMKVAKEANVFFVATFPGKMVKGIIFFKAAVQHCPSFLGSPSTEPGEAPADAAGASAPPAAEGAARRGIDCPKPRPLRCAPPPLRKRRGRWGVRCVFSRILGHLGHLGLRIWTGLDGYGLERTKGRSPPIIGPREPVYYNSILPNKPACSLRSSGAMLSP